MAKGRSRTKANAVKLSKGSIRGLTYKKDGGIITPYQQGYEAYFNGMHYDEAERKGDQFWLGWRHGLESDKKLYSQCSKAHVLASIEARIHGAYKIAA